MRGCGQTSGPSVLQSADADGSFTPWMESHGMVLGHLFFPASVILDRLALVRLLARLSLTCLSSLVQQQRSLGRCSNWTGAP